MQKQKQIGRIRWVMLVVVGILSAGSASQAAPLLIGPTMGFAPAPAALPGGTPAPATLAPLSSTYVSTGPGPTITGSMDSYVFQGDPDNPWAGAGGLTFVFQVHNAGSEIDRFTSTDFTGFQTDVAYANLHGTDVTPIHVDRKTAITVGWDFDIVNPGQETSLLIVRTDAKQWQISNGNVIDGQVASAAVYGPFGSSIAPEPTSLMLLAGFGMLSLRRRK